MTRQLKRIWLHRVRIVILVLLIVSVFAAVVPFLPETPGSNLDYSWKLALNEAVARRMIFGRDIVFTFGPFASVFTKTYHPATDVLMMGGSLYLASCIAMLLFTLSRRTSGFALFMMAVLFGGYMYTRDVFLIFFPLLWAAVLYRIVLPRRHPKRIPFSQWHTPLLAWTSGGLAMLPLVKGSLLVVVSGMFVLGFLLLWIHGMRKRAAMIIFSYVSGTVFFWTVSGQPLSALFPYIRGLLPVISGYTEAMAYGGTWFEVAEFLLTAIAVLFVVVTVRKTPRTLRLYLLVTFGLYLFSFFKIGTVRQDTHMLAAGNGLMAAAILLFFICEHRLRDLIFIMSLITFAVINVTHHGRITGGIRTHLDEAYMGVVRGIALRLRGNAIREEFQRDMKTITSEYPVRKMEGTTDVYSYGQSYLLASGNGWNPRPVFQSYAAYTPELLRINRDHLLGKHAPSSLLFRVETIDVHLPSLDDGLSWPVLLHNYRLTGMDKDYLYLGRKSQTNSMPGMIVVAETKGLLGRPVVVPKTGPLFVSIEMKQTMMGKLMTFLYKPTRLVITVRLLNGSYKRYQVVSGMMKTGFLLSPLVETTGEFANLLTEKPDMHKAVTAFVIKADSGGGRQWDSSYAVRFERLEKK